MHRPPVQEIISWLKPAVAIADEIKHVYLWGISSENGSQSGGDDLYLVIVADIESASPDRVRTRQFRWLTELAASRRVYWEVIVCTPEEATQLGFGTDQTLPDDCVHVFTAE